jgi:hypothetical protein
MNCIVHYPIFITVDIGKLNRVLDKFMKRLYGVDVYVTTSDYRDGNYNVNILFFPSKFLKRSPDYSEKYFRFYNRSEREIESDIIEAFRLFGIDKSKINGSRLKVNLSLENSEYLQNYIKELLYNINNFFKTEIIDDLDFSDIVSKIKLERIDHVGLDWYSPPYLSLRLSHNYFDEDSPRFADVDYLLNNDFVRKPLIDYLQTKMELDPQINFWFEHSL